MTDNIPPYAILSHTLGEEEVTSSEFLSKTGKNKPGYAKIKFCREQAAKDSLQFFWGDTCCINKASSDELSTAIISMFRWYKQATKMLCLYSGCVGLY